MDVRITSMGWYAAGRVETAAQLAPLIGRSEDWITRRTGVARRWVSDESMAEMGAEAARRALGDGPPPDLILNTSLTPVQLLPDSSVFIQRALGTEGIPSFSIHATCLSFLVGLQAAVHFAAAGTWRRILLVSAEKGTTFRDLSAPESAALIGDGAAAAVLEPGGGKWIDFALRTWPEGAAYAEFRGAGTRSPPGRSPPEDNLFQMNGPRIFRLGHVKLREVMFALLDKHGLTLSELDLIVPHQMSGPGIEAFRRGGVRDDQLVDIVGEYGNCIAASIPMALAIAQEQGRLFPGAKVLLVGTGAGISVAAALMRW
ncbi:MAG TPA: ketoacyl-ACP synthase III [Deltaproteobacteria bacterium]|nr:ketoacyl-ACP synthase III [Deltaproteobacteria bacterium]